MDNAFLTKLTEMVEAHLSDPAFGVDKLARKMNMSYSSLWRRVSKNSGKSANQFIREIRLKKSLEILQEEDLTIAEVAHRTGFSSPNYFSTCFQDFFGYSPGELKRLGGIKPEEIQKADDGKNKAKASAKSLKNYFGDRKLSWKFILPALIVVMAAVVIIYSLFWYGNQRKSIAVLFPENLSHDSRTESFCGGFQEQLLNELHLLGQLKVRGRVSTDQFRKTTMLTPRIGRKLNAKYIVTGAVSMDGDDVTISVHLINAKEDKQEWAHQYRRKMVDQFTLQDEIVADVLWEIKRVLLPEIKEPTTAFTEYDSEAVSWFKQGKHYANLTNPKLNEAYKCFTSAIRIDSSYAEAYIELAATLNRIYSDIEKRHDTLLINSLLIIDKVAKLNSSLPGIHNHRGLAFFLSGNFIGAVDEFKAELEINHESDEALMNISGAYMSLGMWNLAGNSLNKYFERESYSLLPNYLLGQLSEFNRDFRKAKEYYKLASSIDRTHGPSLLGHVETSLKSAEKLGNVRALLDSLVHNEYNDYPDSLRLSYEYAILDMYEGKYHDAIGRLSGWERAAAKSPPYYFRPKQLLLAQAFGYLNDPLNEQKWYDSARVFIEDLEQSSEGIRNDPRVKSALGIAYAGLGQREKAWALATETIDMLTINPDAWLGPYAIEDVAFIYTQTGKYTEAIQILSDLLANPGPLTFSLLEVDPRWAPLRGKEGYKELGD